MKKHSAFMFLCLLGGGLFLAGSQNSINTLENANQSAQTNFIVDQRVVTDAALSRRLALQSVNLYLNRETGNQAVEVTAQNVRTGFWGQFWSGLTGDNPYRVDYKFIWKDEYGFTVETPLSAWRTAVIIPGETVYFKSVAPNNRCRDFILNLKESN